MDFRQMNSTPVSKPEPAQTGGDSAAPTGKRKRFNSKMPQWLNVLNVVILFGIAALLVLLALLIARGGSTNEGNLVDKTKYQAVFLNNGQVYFGNVTAVTKDYVRLNNIYYLTQNGAAADTQTSNGDYTLVKLGCQQIHYPYDQMVVNRSQISFWENLNADGKVAKSIEEFKKQNPNGPDCTQVTTQTQSDAGTTQGGTDPTNQGTGNTTGN